MEPSSWAWWPRTKGQPPRPRPLHPRSGMHACHHTFTQSRIRALTHTQAESPDCRPHDVDPDCPSKSSVGPNQNEGEHLQTRPALAHACTMLAQVGQTWATPGRSRTPSGQARANFGGCWPRFESRHAQVGPSHGGATCCQTWSASGQCWPSLPEPPLMMSGSTRDDQIAHMWTTGRGGQRGGQLAKSRPQRRIANRARACACEGKGSWRPNGGHEGPSPQRALRARARSRGQMCVLDRARWARPRSGQHRPNSGLASA